MKMGVSINKVYLLIVNVLSFCILISCNKEIEHKLDLSEDGKASQVQSKSYKVLYVVMEGAVGNIIGAEATDYGKAPQLAALLENSLFTWNAVSTDVTNDYNTYADILSGVKNTKHLVKNGDLTNTNWTAYPSFIHYLKESKNLKSAVFTSNNAMAQLLTAQGDMSTFVSSDEEVLSKSLVSLSEEENDIVLVTFKSIKEAGEVSGYSPNSSSYMDAIAKVDGYVGQLIQQIRKRKDYKTENWLTIVVSNMGGDYELPPYLNDGTIYSEMKRNNFIIVNNKSFSYRSIDRPNIADPTYDGYGVRYTTNKGYAVLDEQRSNLYNFGTGKDADDFTLSFKLKVLARHTDGNAIIIGKQASAANFNAGWSVTYNGLSGWRFIANQNSASGYTADTDPLELDTWYSLAVKLYKEGDKRYAQAYRNGQPKGNRVDVTGRDYTSKDVALQFGYKAGGYGNIGNLSHIITDVRIWKTALSDSFIAANSCSTLALPTDPYYNSLIGYWPAVELGGEIRDYSPSRNHMELKGEYTRPAFAERSTALCPTFPTDLDAMVIRNVDIPLFIYNWFGVNSTTELNLDSKSWTPNYGNN